MNEIQTFGELTETMRPQDPYGDDTGLRFKTGEHGGDYPDDMPQAITVTCSPRVLMSLLITAPTVAFCRACISL